LVKFADQFPRRFINVGVAEQAMIGMAAGLALKGLRPFCYTIAPFALYRPFEFIRDDLAYQNLPVTVVGMGAGLSYSSLGGTHQAIEDVSIASSIPNMQVFAPHDPWTVKANVSYLAKHSKRPTYLRLGKAGEPNLKVMELGAGFTKPAHDTLVIGYGPILADFTKDFDVLSLTVLKPLDEVGIYEVMHRYKRVVVVEEHTPWLGFRIRSIVQKNNMRCEIHTFALKDEFIHYFGSRAELLEKHGLTLSKIFDAIGRQG
jgi:transketolase